MIDRPDLAEQAGQIRIVAGVDDESLRLRAEFAERCAQAHLVSACDDDRGTRGGPRRAALRTLLQRGVDTGELAATTSLDLVVDFAFGAMWYRLLSRHAVVDAALAREVTAAVAATLTPRAGGKAHIPR
ncbi:TetR-like C-terminal domain-containing protein [Nocardia sp. NPDC004568]|uniref:TetR-like C-terminal domain-containing protein n=1 Tax=Nocardia sp. NPDC004568 TaxID=3154551 RepID=UPI0033AB303E